ncbi:methionine adenosyltransferase [endosymbiont of Ridgeia piscesae]|jgi:S-adenosylmethionine synthetase|uniref:Archaeal S-adenosylmethionine synthetase n=1 Tax=endosymbiont of Ridgeia piscesae TaxID=54398 RepID=A0A0T5Z6D3_9GAMM|nr:methionine adenosyltransferase [endosymbiont of Ridgeia piscesae]KRT56565.1 Archaeal S-adenosylmethionine synthetase [endosymbiont of Ridgeia piscesae]KRT58457.1 methionine adenosyltransferase [endosymbiont of Ridgeia piscesae]
MQRLTTTAINTIPYAKQPVEIVERKGMGHPDTICDALAEELSRSLCQFYLEHFGLVLHHNVDKALLWGGTSQPLFGGGKILAPMEIFLAGRATCAYKGIRVPVEELMHDSASNWLESNFHVLDPAQHIKLHCLIRPGSMDLVELYLRQKETGIALANDTSCGVGYAPLSELERVVLQIENKLNSNEIKSLHPEIGEDIKVMGTRRCDTVELTIACAFIDRYISSLQDYFDKKLQLASLVEHEAKLTTHKQVMVTINAADDIATKSIYLTVTGTSAESGDDGEVGRGNRVNGLITPYRPMNMEAAAGKNPVTHVGKLYNIVAQQIADSLVQELDEIEEAYCYLVSQIGSPINEPKIVDLRLQLRSDADIEGQRSSIAEIVHDKLTNISLIQQMLTDRSIHVY